VAIAQQAGDALAAAAFENANTRRKEAAAADVKKLVETGYLSQKRSLRDRRTINVRLTEKGTKLHDRLQSMHQRHAEMLERTAVTDKDLHAASVTLRRLEHFWTLIPDLEAVAG
jgi:predicted transcriptional regulator